MTKHNTPALRFAGFDDEWAQSRLSDHLTLSEDTNANLEFGREDVYAVSLEEGLVNQIKFHGRSFAGKNLDNYDVIHAGEIVYTKSPLKFTPYGIFKSHFGATGIVSPLYAVYRTKPHADARFVQDYFALPERLNTYLSPLVNKGAKNTMNISDWNALGGAVTFPPSLEEQRAIGELLADLDALIEQHRAKHANLQRTKTALMQRMFPQDGADEPELRLGGFSGAWEAKPLKDLGSSYGGLTGKTKEDFGHGDARYITYLDVFERALINDASRLGATYIDNRQNEVKTGDVLFTVSSEVPEEVGMSAVWLGQGQNIYLNSFCFGFRPTAELDSKFLAYVLRSPDFREKMTLLAQGISRFNISKTRAMELEISFPTLEEQRAIGEVFADLDALIATEHRYITQLTQAKAALLQRMFV